MTDKPQPEALRLADEIHRWNNPCAKAAAELRRQHARIAELEAARFAYASEFEPNSDGNPDVGSIHANIRAMKAKLASSGAGGVQALSAAHKAAPQQEAQEPCPTCVALARAVMLDQVSFDRKPDCYGIRQVTDDESVEEWEDIRTSPDVAREEANDMMATGRGEIYEVVPLWTTPQPSLTAKAAGSVLEDAARLDWLALAGPVSICVVIDRPHDGEVEVSTDDVTGYGKTLREAIDAAIAAQKDTP